MVNKDSPQFKACVQKERNKLLFDTVKFWAGLFVGLLVLCILPYIAVYHCGWMAYTSEDMARANSNYNDCQFGTMVLLIMGEFILCFIVFLVYIMASFYWYYKTQEAEQICEEKYNKLNKE